MLANDTPSDSTASTPSLPGSIPISTTAAAASNDVNDARSSKQTNDKMLKDVPFDDLFTKSDSTLPVTKWVNSTVNTVAEKQKHRKLDEYQPMDVILTQIAHRIRTEATVLERKIERQTMDFLNNIPRVVASVDTLERDITTLTDALDSLGKRVEGNIDDKRQIETSPRLKSTAAFAGIRQLDQVIERMQTTKGTLKEAETWLTLHSEISSSLASGDLLHASLRLRVALKSVAKLKGLPAFKERNHLIQNQYADLIAILVDRTVKIAKLLHSKNQPNITMLLDELKVIFNCSVLVKIGVYIIGIYENEVTTLLDNFINMNGDGSVLKDWLFTEFMPFVISCIQKCSLACSQAFFLDDTVEYDDLTEDDTAKLVEAKTNLPRIILTHACIADPYIHIYLNLSATTEKKWPGVASMYSEMVATYCVTFESLLDEMDTSIISEDARKETQTLERSIQRFDGHDAIGMKASDSIPDLTKANFVDPSTIKINRIANSQVKKKGDDTLWIYKLIRPFISCIGKSTYYEKIQVQTYSLPLAALEACVLAVARTTVSGEQPTLREKDVSYITGLVNTTIDYHLYPQLNDRDISSLILTLKGSSKTAAPATTPASSAGDASSKQVVLSRLLKFNHLPKVLNMFLTRTLIEMCRTSIDRISVLTCGLALPHIVQDLDTDVIPTAIKSMENLISHFRVEHGLTSRSKVGNYYDVFMSRKRPIDTKEYASTNTLDGVRANSSKRKMQRMYDDKRQSMRDSMNGPFYFDETGEPLQSEKEATEMSEFEIFMMYAPILGSIDEAYNGLASLESQYLDCIVNLASPLSRSKPNEIDGIVLDRIMDTFMKYKEKTNGSQASSKRYTGRTIPKVVGKMILDTELSRNYVEKLQNTSTSQHVPNANNPQFTNSRVHLATLARDIQLVIFDAVFNKILTQVAQFDSDPNAWTKNPTTRHGPYDINLPQFNVSPSGFITRIGEYFLMLPQQIEQVVTSTKRDMDDLNTNNGAAHPLASHLHTIPYFNHTSMWMELTVESQDNITERKANLEAISKLDTDDVSLVWITALVQGLVECYLSKVFRYINVRAPAGNTSYAALEVQVGELVKLADAISAGAKGRERISFSDHGIEQVMTDMNYLKNITIALDVDPVPRILNDTLESLRRISPSQN